MSPPSGQEHLHGIELHVAAVEKLLRAAEQGEAYTVRQAIEKSEANIHRQQMQPAVQVLALCREVCKHVV